MGLREPSHAPAQPDPRDRPGHHQHPRDRVRRGRASRARRSAARADAALSAGRAGSSTIRRRSGRTRSRSSQARVAAAAWPRPRSPRSASPTSARPALLWERRDRQAGPPRHRLAGPAHRRRSAGSCRRTGLEPLVQERTGLLIDPYFSATKLAWLLDKVPGARAAAERGELAFGTIDSFLLWRLTGGTGACDRRDQRLAHDALRHPSPGLGRRAAAPARHPARAAARGQGLQRRCSAPRRPSCSARRCRSPASPATSRRRPSARPASRPA